MMEGGEAPVKLHGRLVVAFSCLSISYFLIADIDTGEADRGCF